MRLHRSIFIVVLLLGSLLLSCSDSNGPEPPQIPNIVLSSSFELNGIGSLNGWTYNIQIDTLLWPHQRHVNFSSDVPPNGGAYSIELSSLAPDTTYSNIYYPWSITHDSLRFVNGRHVYRFSFWGKSLPVGGWVAIWHRQIVNGVVFRRAYSFIPVTDTVWTFYSIADTISSSEDIYLQLSASTSSATTANGPLAARFDLCTMTVADQ